MKQKLKIGQFYRVRKDLIVDDIYNGLTFVPEMEKYLGKKVKFVEIDSDGYGCVEDGWYFNSEMLQLLPQSKCTITDLPTERVLLKRTKSKWKNSRKDIAKEIDNYGNYGVINGSMNLLQIKNMLLAKQDQPEKEYIKKTREMYEDSMKRRKEKECGCPCHDDNKDKNHCCFVCCSRHISPLKRVEPIERLDPVGDCRRDVPMAEKINECISHITALEERE
jgi:hypothetical protein